MLVRGAPSRVRGGARSLFDRSDIRAALGLGVDVARAVSLVYVAALILRDLERFSQQSVAIGAVCAMTAWTAAAPFLYRLRRPPPTWVLALDLTLSVALVLVTRWAQDEATIAAGAATLPGFWVSAAVLGWAVVRGPVGGIFAAGIIGVADLAVIGEHVNRVTVENIAQLLIIGSIVGWISRLGVAAERSQAEAAALRAATIERERLAADIHDGVLQVLSLVRRRTAGLPGDVGQLADLAGDQEAAVRALAVGRMSPPGPGITDLRQLLQRQARSQVIVSVPAEPVLLPSEVAHEVAAAVAAALDNVEKHVGAGAQAWVLVEDGATEVVVTVRDDGQGVTQERLAAARSAGRLGVSASIEARIRALGGSAVVLSAPQEGTEVELRVPR